MKFFFDACLSPKYAAILRCLKVNVTELTTHFADDCEDPDWIPKVADEKWVAVTFDIRIRKNPVIAEVLEREELHIYLLPSKVETQKLFQQAAWLLKVWPTLSQHAVDRREADPYVYVVTENGKILSWDESKAKKKKRRKRR